MASLASLLPRTPSLALLHRSPPPLHSLVPLPLLLPSPRGTGLCRPCCTAPRSAVARTSLAARTPALRPRVGGKVPPCRAAAESEAVGDGAGERKTVSLGTAVLPADCDLAALETMMAQWATSLTQDANLPLQSPLKVDKIPGGVQLTLQVTDADTTKPVDIQVTVEPPSADAPAMFRAVRSGPHCQITPPGEPALMASMLSALRKSVALSRP